MSTFWNVLIVILLVLVIALALLYYFGQKAQKKQAAQQEQLEATRQVVSMLIIDKKRLKLKESGLPQIVIDQTPWYMRRTKIPVVKAKIGPKIQTLISETTIFDSIPVKKEIKAVVSGIYITEIKSVRGGRVEAPQQKEPACPSFRKASSQVKRAQCICCRRFQGKEKEEIKTFKCMHIERYGCTFYLEFAQMLILQSAIYSLLISSAYFTCTSMLSSFSLTSRCVAEIPTRNLPNGVS